jgi:hypothetical protein
VPSGTYTELRFVISGACLAVENETGGSDIYSTADYDSDPCGGPATGTLVTPSYDESGLKVVLEGDALALVGGQKILLVDFDVQQSFGQVAGQSGQWVMHPVVTGGEIEASMLVSSYRCGLCRGDWTIPAKRATVALVPRLPSEGHPAAEVERRTFGTRRLRRSPRASRLMTPPRGRPALRR